MSKKKRLRAVIIFACAAVVLMLGTILIKSPGGHLSIKEMMRDAVLHETNKINLLGIKEINPGLASAFAVTGVILIFALIVRIFVIPKFKLVVSRARKIQRFLSQPTHVAEKFTGIKGVYVPLKETIKGFEAIIGGEADDYAEAAFYNVGTIDEAYAKNEKIKAGEI